MKNFSASTNVIKELVLNASDNEFKTIKEHLITLDFLNGDIHHFLKSLAEAYIKKIFKQKIYPVYPMG